MTHETPYGLEPMRVEWWTYAAAGVISILFGLAAILWPGLTLVVLVYLFGIFALVEGGVTLIQAFRAMQAHQTWWPQLLLGLIGIGAGLFVLAYPGLTAVALLLAIAFWAIFLGVVEIVAGLFGPDFLLLIIGVISVVFGFVLLGNPGASVLALIVVIGVFAIVRGLLLLFAAARAPDGTLPV